MIKDTRTPINVKKKNTLMRYYHTMKWKGGLRRKLLKYNNMTLVGIIFTNVRSLLVYNVDS